MSYVKKVKKLGKDICSEGSVIRGRTARTAIKSIRENDCGGSGGGVEINGNITPIKAGEDISAGDFITLKDREILESLSLTYGVRDINALALDDSRLLIVYLSNEQYLHAIVAEVSGNILSQLSDDVQINYNTTISPSGYQALDIVRVDSTKFLILYGGNSNVLVLINISNNNVISLLNEIKLEDDNIGHNIIQTSSGALISFYSSTDDMYEEYLAMKIIRIEDTSIEYSSVAVIEEDYSAGKSVFRPQATLIDGNKIFLQYVNYDGDLQGSLITIIEDTPENLEIYIEATDTICWADEYKGSGKPILLEQNKLFIPLCFGMDYDDLYGSLITLKSNSFTISNSQLNSSVDSCYGGIKACEQLNNNKAVVVHTIGNQGDTYMSVVSIQNNKLVVDDFFTSPLQSTSTQSYSSIRFPNHTFINSIGKNNNCINTLNFSSEKAYTTKNEIEGVAKTSGTTGETIEVYVPRMDT